VNSADLIQLIYVGATVLMAVIAYVSWRASHHSAEKDSAEEQIKHALHPFRQELALLQQTSEARERLITTETESLMVRAVQPLREDIAVLKSQMILFQDMWKQLAFEMAKVLHQPDPLRHHIDKLLEALIEETLSAEEELELRKYLVEIRNWEPGTDLGYPVRDGEQTAAAILLRTMPHVVTPRVERTR
jgi:hypothetical protein